MSTPNGNKRRRMIPCPKGCGNEIRYSGPNDTSRMCRSCYHEEMRSPDGRRRQQALQQAARARQANVTKAHMRKLAKRTPPVDLMSAPMNHLWLEADKVFDFIAAEVGQTARMELSKHPGMAARWDTWRGRGWLRYDQVDEMLCVLGLWIGDLGEPTWSGSDKRYPVLEAV